LPPRGEKTQSIFENLDEQHINVPSESAAEKPVPLPIIGVVNTEVRISGQRRVICVETFNIICAIEF